MSIGFRFRCILQWHPIRCGFGSTVPFHGNRNSKLPLACPGILRRRRAYGVPLVDDATTHKNTSLACAPLKNGKRIEPK